VIPLPSAENDTTEEAVEVDERRQELLGQIQAELGDAVVDTHLVPNRDLWVRVNTEAWSEVAAVMKNTLRYRFFDWLSAIDWMPSPYGRSMDSEVDKQLEDSGEETEDADVDPTVGTGANGYAGGESRMQVLARVHSLQTGLGVAFKADVPDLTIGTWTDHFPGADWHEREAWEMFGINFEGHPGLRALYLPGDFQGHPLRKDYPLLARIVKPWPGIVDVEPMPDPAEAKPSTTNPEAG